MKFANKISHQNYFDGVRNSDEYYSIIVSAENLEAEQKITNSKFKSATHRYADVNLTDKSRYRKGKDFKSEYHRVLYYKYKNGKRACPVMELNLYLEQKERNKSYFKKVNSENTYKKRHVRKNLMPFDEAKEIFIESYLKPAIESKNEIFDINEKSCFVLDERNEKVISNLVAYFTRQEDSELKLNKGICLFGNIGTGKSTIMKELSRFTNDHNLETMFDFIYMDDVYTECDSTGLSSLDSYKFRACCFDDIGMRAESNVNNFGTKINSYKELVRRQYNRFSRPTPSLSHYTTNITYNDERHIKDMIKVFGSRELDRFREMCNFVGLFGESLRNFG